MTIGVDVSKDTLVHCTRDGYPSSVENSAKAVKGFLSRLPAGTTIAMEATGRYHRLLADTDYAMGFVVIVLNPKDVNRYAKSVSPRAATDPIAAQIIAEFASVRNHRPYVPPPAFVEVLRNLVRTRAGLVKQRVALGNQAGEDTGIAGYLTEAIAGISQSITKLDKQIVEAAKCRPEYQLLVKIPGFGPLVSSYMLATLASGEFISSDAFVAFIGLDLRVRESGKLKGRRKLARVAWAIYRKQQPYNAQRVLSQPSAINAANPEPEAPIIRTVAKTVDKRIANTVLRRARSTRFLDNHNAINPNKHTHSPQEALDSKA